MVSPTIRDGRVPTPIIEVYSLMYWKYVLEVLIVNILTILILYAAQSQSQNPYFLVLTSSSSKLPVLMFNWCGQWYLEN